MKSCRWLLLIPALALFAASPSQGLAQERKFNDQDRKAAQDYHDQHKNKPAVGFRSKDKLRAEDDSRVREGAVLDPDLRRQSHPIPADMSRRLPPLAKGHRYVVVGGHVCDVDSGWHISDVIHITL